MPQGGHTIWTEEGFDLNSFIGENEAEAEPEPAAVEQQPSVAMVSAVAQPIKVFIPDSPDVQQATRKVLKRRPTHQGELQAGHLYGEYPSWENNFFVNTRVA